MTHYRQPGASPCPIPGCNKQTVGYHKYCSKHHWRHHVHGHPLQEPMTLSGLRPFLGQLKIYERTAEGRKAIDAVVDHYRKLALEQQAERLEDIRATERTGILHATPRYWMTRIVSEVFDSRDHRQTVLELLAMGLMLQDHGDVAFKSDRAYWFQLANVFMRNSSAVLKTRFDSKKGKIVSRRKSLNLRAKEACGRWLSQNIVIYGVMIARHWQSKDQSAREEHARIVSLIKGDPTTSTGELVR